MTRQNRPHPIKVQHQVELSQEVITGNIILKPKRVEKLILRALPSHHAAALRCCYNGITSMRGRQEFSERSALRVFNEAILTQRIFQQHRSIAQVLLPNGFTPRILTKRAVEKADDDSCNITGSCRCGSLLRFMTMAASGQAASDRASTGEPAAVGQIKELLRKYEVSIDNIDLNLANQVWSHTPEVIFIDPRGTERGLRAIEKTFYEETMGNTFFQRQLLIESPAIHVYGDAAWGEFTWTFHATTRNGGKQMTTQGRESQVYHKENGTWRVVCDHYSGLPVPAHSRASKLYFT